MQTVKAVPLLFMLVLLLHPGSGAVAEKADSRAASAPRQLLITVLQTADAEEARELLSRYRGDDHRAPRQVSRYVHMTRRYRNSTRTGQVRVLEGQAAILQLGRVVPEVRLLWVEDRHRAPVPTAGFGGRPDIQGFHVRAALEAGRVRLEVTQHGNVPQTAYAQPPPQQMLATTLTGEPGVWLDLGGTLALDDTAADAAVYTTHRRRPGETRVLVRVEPAD